MMVPFLRQTKSIFAYFLSLQPVPIISTLLFQIIIFERYSRSKIKNDKTFSFASDSVVVNILNDDRNYCSTILHVRVRTKYSEVNILKIAK